jgi:hypothetical protein
MSEEFERRFERHVEFMLSQQAKFDASMDRLEAAQAKTEQTLARATENINHLGAFIHEGFGLTMNLFKDTDEKFKDTDARFKDTDAKIQALAEEHKLTQEELRKLMGRVNRHLSEDHGLEN